MSNGNPLEQDNQPAYRSEFSDAFSQAWNEVNSDESTPPDGAGAPEGAPAGASETGAPATLEPTRATGDTPPGAPGDGTPSTAPDIGSILGGQAPEPTGSPAGSPSADALAGGAPAGTPGVQPGTATTIGGFTHASAAPLLDAAAKGINERSEQGFRTRAIGEVREQIAPEFLDAINNPARFLVGETLPSLHKPNETETIKSLEDAKNWQETAQSIITKQVNTRTAALLEDARPTLSILQDSVQMFQQNKDMIPGTAEFNPALAKAFVKMAKAYEVRNDGKLLGYKVDVQPLIDHLRTQIAAPPAAPTPRQEQAAGQVRNEAGQFDAPQAGIPNKAGISGEPGDDYSAFWAASGVGHLNI